MNRSIQFARIMQVIAVAAVLVVSQVVAAQSTGVEPIVLQWVIDRQQYETTYVPSQSTGVVSVIPQWVIDRQQYEITYAPSHMGDTQQWVIDRQQYETTYVPLQIGDTQPIAVVLQPPA